MGRMTNMFNLTARMIGRTLITGKAHSDGSPIHNSRPAFMEKARNPAEVQIEDKTIDDDPRANPLWKRSSGLPMKRLMVEGMSEDKQKGRKNVVAKLMGLDEFPDHQSVPATTMRTQDGNLSNTSKIHEVFQLQQDAYLHVAPSDLSCRTPAHKESFTCLTTSKKLCHSEEFQDAIVSLASDRDSFHEVLQEPNLFPKHPLELQHNTISSEKTRIVVLKPLRMVKLEKEEQLKAKLFPAAEEQKWNINKHHRRSTSFDHATAEHLPKPIKIVVLKPNQWKSRNVLTCISPRNLVGSSLETDESTASIELNNWRDESLVSSSSFGYTGDESLFEKSVNELMEHEDANFSELECLSPTSQYSWGCSSRSGSPYPSHTMARHSPETLVDREAKKRLSERWALVTSNGNHPGECSGSGMSSTLGEMLTIPKLKKEEEHDGGRAVSRSRSCSEEHRTAPLAHSFAEDKGTATGFRNLSNSKCVSSSSDHEAIGISDRVSETPVSKSGARNKFAKSKYMLSVKGRLSNFFASWNKRIGRVKSSPSSLVGSVPMLPPQCTEASCHRNEGSPKFSSDNHPEDTTRGDFEGKSELAAVSPSIGSVGDFEENSELAAFPPSIPSGPTQSAFSAEASVCHGKSNAAQNFTSKADHFSPSSVLDAPFEDDGTNGRPHAPEDDHDLENTNIKWRSLSTELVPRHLSWDDANLEAGVPSVELRGVFLPSNEEEQEQFSFIRKILSSAGLEGEHSISASKNWHSPDRPLDPKLLEKFSDRKEEENNSSKVQLNCRLIFDCVNSAVLEICQSAIWAACPWRRACGDHWKHGQVCGSSCTITAQVWMLIRPRLSSVVCQTSPVEPESINDAVECIVSRDIAIREWGQLAWLEVDEFSKEVGDMLLEELVEELLVEMCAGWQR